MNTAYLNSTDFSFFNNAQIQLTYLIEDLESKDSETNAHGDIERFINKKGQEILRELLQGWLNLTAAKEETQRQAIGKHLTHIHHKTNRKLKSLFGDVTVNRKGYYLANKSSRYLLDGQLNLSQDCYSDGRESSTGYKPVASGYG